MGRELTSEAPEKRCALLETVGRVEACPGDGCPFWEEGGAVLEGGCAIERLSLDLAHRPELAQYLLEIRLDERPASVHLEHVLEHGAEVGEGHRHAVERAGDGGGVGALA